jgi:cardiolipin synthase A/B
MRRWLRGWKFWVVVGLALTGFLLMLAQDQDTVRVQSPVAVTDTGFPEYLASLVGASVQHGDTYTVLRNGDQVFPAMLDAIKQAQSRISMESFIYEDGQVGDQFTLALSEAAKRGVTVRIVLDAIGGELSQESQDTLTDAGVMLVWFNTVRPWTLEETNYRTHRKVLVVDGSVGFTGGLGLADHWIGNADTEEHWRDTQFKVMGPAVRALEAGFYENWLESGGQVVPTLDPERSIEDTGTRTIVVWSNPTAGVSNVKLLYMLAIAGARRQIDIQSPYVVLDESTRWSLDDARQRGVKVRILTDGEVTDSMAVKYASRDGYEDLLAKGIEVYEFEPTMMHVKAMVVDGLVSIAGSANFDNRSFELNDEVAVAVSDPQLAAELTRDFEQDLRRSKRLTLEDWQRRGFVEKVNEKFWGMFGELF